MSPIDYLLPSQGLDDFPQRVEARIPDLAASFDPAGHFIEPAQSESAGPYTPDLLQDTNVLLNACESDVELLGKLSDRSIVTAELFQNAASRSV